MIEWQHFGPTFSSNIKSSHRVIFSNNFIISNRLERPQNEQQFNINSNIPYVFFFFFAFDWEGYYKLLFIYLLSLIDFIFALCNKIAVIILSNLKQLLKTEKYMAINCHVFKYSHHKTFSWIEVHLITVNQIKMNNKKLFGSYFPKKVSFWVI